MTVLTICVTVVVLRIISKVAQLRQDRIKTIILESGASDYEKKKIIDSLFPTSKIEATLK